MTDNRDWMGQRGAMYSITASAGARLGKVSRLGIFPHFEVASCNRKINRRINASSANETGAKPVIQVRAPDDLHFSAQLECQSP